MATSTFGKNFAVERKESTKFVKEMCKTVPPTLSKNFTSSYTNLAQNEELRKNLMSILGR